MRRAACGTCSTTGDAGAPGSTSKDGSAAADGTGGSEQGTARPWRARGRDRPGRAVRGRGGGRYRTASGCGRQFRDASASFQVADGRITAEALAGSGW
ncbi:hypothetical protein GCM10018787_01320 [Streptomyces thermodiastaticus]|nr:hypothetical protein GCM10018787_01320 [Streptomyces thermodiastaticus]